jgi:hypothetical protein
MIQSFRLTLYDFFGYLLPGIIVTLAVALFIWPVYFPGKTLAVSPLPTQGLILIGIFSYFAGHLIQALGNLLGRTIKPEERLFGKAAKPSEHAIATAVRSTISSWGIDAGKLESIWLLRICDETLLQNGVVADREIYAYREGFYRGTCGSLLVLTVSLFVMFFSGNAALSIQGHVIELPKSFLLFCLVLSLVCAGMAFFRFTRFAQHRVNSAIAGFLVLQNAVKVKEEKNSDTFTAHE